MGTTRDTILANLIALDLDNSSDAAVQRKASGKV